MGQLAEYLCILRFIAPKVAQIVHFSNIQAYPLTSVIARAIRSRQRGDENR